MDEAIRIIFLKNKIFNGVHLKSQNSCGFSIFILSLMSACLSSRREEKNETGQIKP